MNHFIHGVTRAIVETFELPEPILEIGSYQVAGQEPIANLRTLFPDKKYLGVDMRPGPGVDCVANVEQLPHKTASIASPTSSSCRTRPRRSAPCWRSIRSST